MEGRLGKFVDRVSGITKLKPRIVEALDSLQNEGIAKADLETICERVNKLYPQKHWMLEPTYGMLYRAISRLSRSAEIVMDYERDYGSVRFFIAKLSRKKHNQLLDNSKPPIDDNSDDAWDIPTHF
jgi:hypothetical protein